MEFGHHYSYDFMVLRYVGSLEAQLGCFDNIHILHPFQWTPAGTDSSKLQLFAVKQQTKTKK